MFYSKSENFYFQKTFTEYTDEYKKRYKHEDEKGRFLDRDLTAKGLKGGGYTYSWNGIDGYWRCPESTMKQYEKDGRIYYTRNGTPRFKQYLNDMEGKAVQDLWSDINVINSQSVERIGYSTQKPEKLLKRIIESSTLEGDLVLDFFSGSGTTISTAHKMKRQYIGVEQMDYIETLTAERLAKVVEGEQSGISKEVDWQGGNSFIYFELAQWNEKAKAEILACESLGALEKLFESLYERYFLNYNLKVKEFKEKILQEDNFKALSLDEQKKMFLAMLDLNQLYVQESEMADQRFGISAEDQALTKAFYYGE